MLLGRLTMGYFDSKEQAQLIEESLLSLHKHTYKTDKGLSPDSLRKAERGEFNQGAAKVSPVD